MGCAQFSVNLVLGQNFGQRQDHTWHTFRTEHHVDLRNKFRTTCGGITRQNFTTFNLLAAKSSSGTTRQLANWQFVTEKVCWWGTLRELITTESGTQSNKELSKLKIRSLSTCKQTRRKILPDPPLPQTIGNDKIEDLVIESVDRNNNHTSAPESPRFLLQRLAQVEKQLAAGQQRPNQGDQDNSEEYNSDSSVNPLLLKGAYANVMSVDPRGYQQAQQTTDWNQWELAMKAEFAKMDKYKVLTVVDCQSIGHRKTVGSRWVYTRKIDGNTGKPAAYKARWVAKGYSQIEGIDFDELYAAVAHKDTIRLLLAIVNYFDWKLDQVNIVAAFCNGNLGETIYMEPPEGSEIADDNVLHLNKALYGLKQSPRCFNKSLDKWLQSQGFCAMTGDPCLYIRSNNGNTILLSLHVDDQLIASNDCTHLDQFKQELNAAFECSDGGAANYFLGFNIKRDRRNRVLQIGQQHYFDKVLDMFDMGGVQSCHRSTPSWFHISTSNTRGISSCQTPSICTGCRINPLCLNNIKARSLPACKYDVSTLV